MIGNAAHIVSACIAAVLVTAAVVVLYHLPGTITTDLQAPSTSVQETP